MTIATSTAEIRPDTTTPIRDALGRVFRKLRVSLTEACNYRCFYCMPKEAAPEREAGLITPGELGSIVEGLLPFGIEALRLTGGEPLLRRGFPDFAEVLSPFSERLRLGLTTNGQFLAHHVPHLVRCGFRSVNISLDSLRDGRFRAITAGGDLGIVLAGLRASRDAGLETKVNCVVARGTNDDELADFHDFALREKVEVRFLELMRVGPGRDRHAERFVPASEMLERLESRSPLVVLDHDPDATAFRRRSRDGARLGFVASESRPFCRNCSRLRLSARGELRSCLFRDDATALRGVPASDYGRLVSQVAGLKPEGRLPEVERPMHRTGG